MKRHHFDSQGLRLLYVDEAEPECGKDFCDRCGDCLACYGDDGCYLNSLGDHYWVVYEDEFAGGRV